MPVETNRNINLLNNGEFTSRDVSSSNVGELRNELDIPADANVNVGGTIRQNDFALEDGAYVAYTSNDKVGGVWTNLLRKAIEMDIAIKKHKADRKYGFYGND